jgi:hypothetical protein
MDPFIAAAEDPELGRKFLKHMLDLANLLYSENLAETPPTPRGLLPPAVLGALPSAAGPVLGALPTVPSLGLPSGIPNLPGRGDKDKSPKTPEKSPKSEEKSGDKSPTKEKSPRSADGGSPGMLGKKGSAVKRSLMGKKKSREKDDEEEGKGKETEEGKWKEKEEGKGKEAEKEDLEDGEEEKGKDKEGAGRRRAMTLPVKMRKTREEREEKEEEEEREELARIQKNLEEDMAKILKNLLKMVTYILGNFLEF